MFLCICIIFLFLFQGLKYPSIIIKNPRVREAPGQLYSFDFNNPGKDAVVIPCSGCPAYGTAEFGPHGLSILQHDGKQFVKFDNWRGKWAPWDSMFHLQFPLLSIHRQGLHTQKAYHHSGTSPNLLLLLLSHAYMHFAWELHLDTQCAHLVCASRSNCNKDAYMHEHTTKGFGKMNICMNRFGVRIGWRKYLNECTPFGYVSLCII